MFEDNVNPIYNLNDYEEEQYFVSATEIAVKKVISIFVSTRKEMSELLGLLDPNKYTIDKVITLSGTRTYAKFRQELLEKNKPDNLNFGKEEQIW